MSKLDPLSLNFLDPRMYLSVGEQSLGAHSRQRLGCSYLQLMDFTKFGIYISFERELVGQIADHHTHPFDRRKNDHL